MSSSWADEWAALVRDRAARSCAQAGPRGPPFSSVSAPSLLWSVMPWNWYSVGGTGWCYHADWDVMQRCDQIEDPIDWRGIARAEDGARSGLRLLIAACVVGLCLVANAFATSPPADADAGAPPRPAGPPLEEWLASFRFLPWRWERSAQWTGVGALVGLVAAFVVPLRSTPDLASSPPPEEYTVFS